METVQEEEVVEEEEEEEEEDKEDEEQQHTAPHSRTATSMTASRTVSLSLARTAPLWRINSPTYTWAVTRKAKRAKRAVALWWIGT